ncbi:hypothetical protein [Ketobacter sp.]|uniref:hypothetical protein n=1 Tax=Ketobacter sp. TaxID=2083498 RepID=UPI000F2197CF|nr:hypothetical protein [Ketobacter sp.]RLU00674.1 MAG: hypothetical protein D9N14_05235 [Ketobacter sp.]
MNNTEKLRTWLPLALGLVVLPTLNANAAFVMSLDDLSDAAGPTIIYDGSGSDFGGPLGVITYSGAIGSFNVNVTTGVSKPIVGPTTLDLNSINVTGASGGTLVVKITDTDFTGDYEALAAAFGGTTNGAIDIDFLYDLNNGEFTGTSFAGGSHVASTGNLSFSNDLWGTVLPGEPFSLSIVATIHHNNGGELTSFDATIAPVPLPASALLFGSALAGLGLGWGAKKRRPGR